MFNWELLSPRNIAIIAAMSVIAFVAYNFFHKKITGSSGGAATSGSAQ